jgi:hypothetical protein
MLTDLHALTALDANIGLSTGAFCIDADGGVIGVEFLVKCFGAGLNTLQTGHAGFIFLNSEFLHKRILLLLFIILIISIFFYNFNS